MRFSGNEKMKRKLIIKCDRREEKREKKKGNENVKKRRKERDKGKKGEKREKNRKNRKENLYEKVRVGREEKARKERQPIRARI